MHEERSNLSGFDKARLERLEATVERVDRYVKHIVGLLPEDQRTPREPTEDAPPEVVSVGTTVRDEAMAALRSELESEHKSLPEPKGPRNVGRK